MHRPAAVSLWTAPDDMHSLVKHIGFTSIACVGGTQNPEKQIAITVIAATVPDTE